MSGGSMDYAYERIEEAASYIQAELAQQKLRLESGVFDEVHTAYANDIRYADKTYLKSGQKLQAEVVRRLREALRTVRLAAKYAKAVEWFTSGDDGPESFCIGLDDEVGKVRKHGGVE